MKARTGSANGAESRSAPNGSRRCRTAPCAFHVNKKSQLDTSCWARGAPVVKSTSAMGGRLEHEIRLLPQVLSCSLLRDDYVVVLIDPSADPRTIQLLGERILHTAGSAATVRGT